MHRFSGRRSFAPLVMSLALTAGGAAAPAHAITWTTAYNQTSSVTNQLRAVEVSEQAGVDSVYTGFIQTTGGNRTVDQFSMTSPYPLLNTRAPAEGNDQPKAIATDDRGYVYVGNRQSGGNNGQISVTGATLGAAIATKTTDVALEQFGGLASAHFDGHYYLYASREATTAVSGAATPAQIRRYIADDPLNITLDTTFGTGGIFAIPGANKTLRGLDVSNDGTIFVTSRDGNAIYRVSSDLATVTTATLTRAMDVALFGGKAYVTSYNGASSLIRVFDAATLNFDSDISITTLDGNPYTRGASEGWGGIDIDSLGRIWLGDENYNLSGTTSDRLLVSSPVPEPTTLAILGIGACGLVLGRRRS